MPAPSAVSFRPIPVVFVRNPLLRIRSVFLFDKSRAEKASEQVPLSDPLAGFEEWVVEIKTAIAQFEKETGKKAAPFGVNLIVNPMNTRVQPDLEICIKHQVPLIITSLGAVPQLVDAVHAYGGLVFHDIIKKRHAEKAAQAGVDGLILVAGGAGGHAGTLHPIALMHEIKQFFSKTILLSGCLSTGQDIASALQMGADLAYMGTRFINVQESK
ncbi:MAG: nitronate monooxygenase, partial [Flavobacteriaceae bacterium]